MRCSNALASAFPAVLALEQRLATTAAALQNAQRELGTLQMAKVC